MDLHVPCSILDYPDAACLEALYFKYASGRLAGRINGTHFLARAALVK